MTRAADRERLALFGLAPVEGETRDQVTARCRAEVRAISLRRRAESRPYDECMVIMGDEPLRGPLAELRARCDPERERLREGMERLLDAVAEGDGDDATRRRLLRLLRQAVFSAMPEVDRKDNWEE